MLNLSVRINDYSHWFQELEYTKLLEMDKNLSKSNPFYFAKVIVTSLNLGNAFQVLRDSKMIHLFWECKHKLKWTSFTHQLQQISWWNVFMIVAVQNPYVSKVVAQWQYSLPNLSLISHHCIYYWHYCEFDVMI